MLCICRERTVKNPGQKTESMDSEGPADRAQAGGRGGHRQETRPDMVGSEGPQSSSRVSPAAVAYLFREQ